MLVDFGNGVEIKAWYNLSCQWDDPDNKPNSTSSNVNKEQSGCCCG